MAVTTFADGLGLVWPAWPKTNARSAIVSDANGEKMAGHGKIWYAGTIAKVHIPFIGVTQSPANGLKVSIQGRARTGNHNLPDGVPTHFCVIPTGSIAANTVAVSPLITDDGTGTGAGKVVAVGDYITIVSEFENFAGGDSVSYHYSEGHVYSPSGYLRAWISWDIGAGWTASTVQGPSWLIEYTDGTIRALHHAAHYVGGSTVSQPGYTAANTPDEYGAKFVAPYSGTIGSMVLFKQYVEDVITTLYDSDDNVLATETTVWDDAPGYTNQAMDRVWFTTPAEVVAGDTYRITQKPGAGTTNFFYYNLGAAAAAQIVGGADFMLTTRTDSGAWTDTATEKPAMGIGYSEIEMPSGGPKIFDC